MFARLIFVLLFWAGAFSALYSLSPQHDSDPIPPAGAVRPSESHGDPSVFGPMRFVSRDPLHDERPLFSAAFQEVFVTAGTAGWFKTGLFKIAHIRSCRVRVYEYGSDLSANPGEGDVPEWFGGGSAKPDHLDRIVEYLTGQPDWIQLEETRIRIDRPDLSDAGQLLIEDLDYRILSDGKARFSIVGKRAEASHEQRSVLVRGGVTVTAADGATLRTNRLRWDPRNKTLSVEGNYLLSRGDRQTAGRTICLDEQLHPIELSAGIETGPATGEMDFILR